MSTSMTRCGRPVATPSGAPAALHRCDGPERAARGRFDAELRAGDRRRRLRQGSANSARGAHRFVTDALITARKSGATGVLVLRADSASYGHGVQHVCVAGALSITAPVPTRVSDADRRYCC